MEKVVVNLPLGVSPSHPELQAAEKEALLPACGFDQVLINTSWITTFASVPATPDHCAIVTMLKLDIGTIEG